VSKKLIIIIAAVALPALGAGGYFGYSMFLAGGGSKGGSPVLKQKAMFKKQRTAMKLRIKQRIDGPIVALGDDFVVNLGGLAHFAKFDVSLKVDKATPLAAAAAADSAATAELEDLAQIRDIVIADTSSYSAGQLATITGKDKLKERIMTDVSNKTNTVALDVYFTGFAIQ
jgi:flagellar basal body-associated protein FliL